MLLLCFHLIQILPQNLMISCIDVGQGDCTLITTPNHKNILIDGGGSSDLKKYDVGEKVLLPYLLNHHIRKIDLMIISHFDSDHCNGLIAILENIKIDKLIIGEQKEISKEYLNIMKIAQDKKIAVKNVQKGDKIGLDKNTYFDVIYPANELSQEGLNNNSLVLELNYNKFSMLFTGDIEKEAEKSIINANQNLKSTILKVAHHGSNTSSTKEFLELVQPKLALIRSRRK
ncbi:MAG: MBL fold metallo-hydrolase [Clostridia bacterium]|nr:MBL fold metallo-hydrolase [Clostridia bacterium]